jgi:hypothetical protein
MPAGLAENELNDQVDNDQHHANDRQQTFAMREIFRHKVQQF